MHEHQTTSNESIFQSLNNLDSAVALAENSAYRAAELTSLANDYNQVFDVEINNAERLIASGTLIIEHANGSISEEPDMLMYGSFSGFETVLFYGKPYLAACIIPEDSMFAPDDEDQVMEAKILISSQPELGGHSLLFDLHVDVLGPKIMEWSAKIRDAQMANKDVFKTLKEDIRLVFSDYAKSILEENDFTQLEAETAAMAEILLYDVEALQYAIYLGLNPANSGSLRVFCRGSIVSINSDNRFDPSVQLKSIAIPTTYGGMYQGVAIRTVQRKDMQGTVTSISPQPCIAMYDDLNEQNVLIPFVSIQTMQFGEQPETHEQLLPSQQVSPEMLDALDIIATDSDYES